MMQRRFRRIPMIVACAALMAAAVGVRGESVFDTAGLLPASAEVVVVVHGGAEVRRSEVGRTAVDAVASLVGFGETGQAWGSVSRAIGMSPEAAFDALLGERMAFASRTDEAGDNHWVVVSQLRPGVRDKLVKSLKTAPRDVAEGSVVLSIEDGAYSMVMMDRPEGAMVIIGPGRRDPMVLEVARVLRASQGKALASGKDMEMLRQLGGGHANLLALVRNPVGEGTWMGMVGVARGRIFDANFRVDIPALADVPAESTRWSRAAFDKLSVGALAAAIDVSGPIDVTGPAADLILPLTLPDDMKAVMGSRVAMVVRPGTHGPVEFAVSVETTDTTAMAKAGDRWIDTLLQSVPVGSQGQQLRANQFVSMPPTANRALDFSRQAPDVRASGWNAGPIVAWNTRIELENCNPGQHQGWWTVGVGAGTVGALGAMVSSRAEDAVQMPWVALGVVRPRALVEVATTLGWSVPEAVRPLGAVEVVRWQAMRPQPTEMLGNLRVEIAPSSKE